MNTRYSFLIKPLFLLIDILLINLIFYWIADKEFLTTPFLIFTNVSWIVIAYFTKFYQVLRTTHLVKIFILYVTQITIFFLSFFSYFSLFREGAIVNNQFLVFVTIALNILFFKLMSHYMLKWYREQGKNFRAVVIIGNDVNSKKMMSFFEAEEDYGYRFLGFFSDEVSRSKKFIGKISTSFNYIIKNGIHEIYCSETSLKKETLKKFANFADKHNIVLKLIPESKDIYSKNLALEYYGVLPVLRANKLPLELVESQIIKRLFDFLFSLIIIVFALSWLVPIVWLIVKIDSKGPLFFSQKRIGLNGDDFNCYKFRSMTVNNQSDIKPVSLHDSRITKVGHFLRKTSIDELPQFFNVLKGDMSVVGPRPHMNKQSRQFEKDVTKYIERHAIRPGITGLAQISGYRGEIRKKSDIENRVRLDIFYIKNWSFFLDIKIIIQTMLNIFRGEENAY